MGIEPPETASRIVFPVGTDLECPNGDMRSNGEAEAAATRLPPPAPQSSSSPAVRDDDTQGNQELICHESKSNPDPPLLSESANSEESKLDRSPLSAKCSQSIPCDSESRNRSQPTEVEQAKTESCGAVTKKPPLPPAGQFTKSAQKRRKAKAKRERAAAAEAAAKSAAGSANSAGFSYSVKYFNWAVSSSESEDEDDEDEDESCCPTVVLPVSMARMRLNEKSKKK